VTIRPSTTPQDLPLVIPSAATPEAQEGSPPESSAGRESIPEPFPSTPHPTMMRPAEPAAAMMPRASLTDRTDPAPPSDNPSRVTPRGDRVPDRVGELRVRPARIASIETALGAAPRRNERAEPAVPAPMAIVPAPRLSAIPERPAFSKNVEQRLEAGVAGPSPTATSSPTRAQAAAEARNIHVKIGKVEIRSTQPAPPGPSARPAPRTGFADFSLVRAYLDRAHR
jgi:hypothetical protein